MQSAAEDLRLLPDHEGRDDFLEVALDRDAARKRELNVNDILGGSPEKVVEALDYPKEVFDAFETYLKGEGVDVEELDLVDEKDKAARRS